MKDSKCLLLETAIEHSNDNGISVSLDQLKEILSVTLQIKKVDGQVRTLLTGETLNRWPTLLKNFKEGAVIEDSSHFIEAA